MGRAVPCHALLRWMDSTACSNGSSLSAACPGAGSGNTCSSKSTGTPAAANTLRTPCISSGPMPTPGSSVTCAQQGTIGRYRWAQQEAPSRQTLTVWRPPYLVRGRPSDTAWWTLCSLARSTVMMSPRSRSSCSILRPRSPPPNAAMPLDRHAGGARVARTARVAPRHGPAPARSRSQSQWSDANAMATDSPY